MMNNANPASALRRLALLTVLGALACNGSMTGPTGMVDSGSWYRSGFRWPHDGQPYESPNFVVYSDGASPEARRTLAEIGEELLATLEADFEIDASMFRFPPGQSKIHMYAYKNRYPSQWGGWGYWGGLLIFSLDHPQRTQFGHTELDNYRRVVTHELTHVVEGLLKGTDDPTLVDVWLTEGIAEYMAGGTAGGNVTSVATLDELIARYGELNPIAMHRYEYPDIEGIGFYYYYPMFELAVACLLDPAGAGVAKSAVRDIYLDVREGVPFTNAFANRFGIDLQQYEDGFFERARAFLSAGGGE